MTNTVTQAYNLSSRSIGDVTRHVDSYRFLKLWAGRYLARPLFVEQQDITAFTKRLRRLLTLLTELPERLFDGDIARFCSVLGLAEPHAALIRQITPEARTVYGRADAYHDGASFKLLEINMSSEVGGLEWAGAIPRALLGMPGFAGFADRHGLDYVDTAAVVAGELLRVGCAVTGGTDPVVAMLEAPGGLAANSKAWEGSCSALRDASIDCRLGEVQELRVRGGKLFLRGTPVDVVFRCFDAEQLLADPRDCTLLDPVLAAQRSGHVAVWTPLECELFGNKRCLAMLSAERRQSSFTDEERAFLDDVLPWTRSLSRMDTELLEYCRDRRAELILKPDAESGGRGVVAGWDTTDREWTRALTEGRGRCVVQQRIEPRPEPVVDPSTGSEQDWRAVWGVMFGPNGYAGAYGRALPAERSAVINVCRTEETRTAGVFQYSG